MASPVVVFAARPCGDRSKGRGWVKMRIQQNDKVLKVLFGSTLKELRTKAEMSQKELADYAELERVFVSTMERGLKQPTLTTLFKLASALKIKPSTITEILSNRYIEYEEATNNRGSDSIS